jgi:geranylgeranyl diphosphate synthase, type II
MTDLHGYLAECRQLAITEIRRLVPPDSPCGPILYDLMLEYPLRGAKGLRPALCIATCRALGGGLEPVLPSAAILELYHNAFLVHDDVEDGSETRRDLPTLHREHGVPIAINVGDAMLALALGPLLDNTQHVGVGKALRIMQVIARMARETAEGQAIELDWVRRSRWDVDDDDYRAMVTKKTSWYSFIAPIAIGAIVAGANERQLAALHELGRELGIAFQIRDDVLNLTSGGSYGKEAHGDLWEGKRTLILLHALRGLDGERLARARDILGKPRRAKSAADVDALLGWITEGDSLAYASAIGHEHARRAREALAAIESWLLPSNHRDVLRAVVEFTVDREN